MDTASPGFVSVRELGERVRTRQVSPVELAELSSRARKPGGGATLVPPPPGPESSASRSVSL